jgi:Restriction endonuclease
MDFTGRLTYHSDFTKKSADLLIGASSRFDIAGPSSMAFVSRYIDLLVEVSERVRIRLLLLDPSSPSGNLEQHLIGETLRLLSKRVPSVDLRLTSSQLVPGLVRTDDQLLLDIAADGNSSMRIATFRPCLQIHRRQRNGLFVEYSNSFERRWSEAIQIPDSSEQTQSEKKRIVERLRHPAIGLGPGDIARQAEEDTLAALRLMGFAPLMDVDHRDEGFDFIGFFTGSDTPCLVEVKARSRPLGIEEVHRAVGVASYRDTSLILVSTSGISRSATALLEEFNNRPPGLRVIHILLSELLQAADSEERSRRLLRAISAV